MYSLRLGDGALDGVGSGICTYASHHDSFAVDAVSSLISHHGVSTKILGFVSLMGGQ